MNKKIRFTVGLILVLFSSVSVMAEDKGKIIVYISGPAEMVNKLEESYEKNRGNVLELVHMGCGPLRQRVWAEWKSGKINADVIWGSDPLIFLELDKEGALYPYTPKGYEMLEARFQQSGNFTLINERYGVVIYNKEKLLNNYPHAFSDLLDKSCKGAIAHADPAQSSTALALIAGLWDIDGNPGNYYRELQQNGLFLTRKNSDVPSKIQEGEFDAGIAPHDAVLRLQKKAKKKGYPTPLTICWPNEGCIAIQRPIAISNDTERSSVDQKQAEDFVDFMISGQAQMITANFGFVSVRKDIPLPAGIPENRAIRSVNWNDLAKRQDSINAEFKAFFR